MKRVTRHPARPNRIGAPETEAQRARRIAARRAAEKARPRAWASIPAEERAALIAAEMLAD